MRYYGNLKDTNNLGKSDSDDYFSNPNVIKEVSGVRLFLFIFAFTILWCGIVLSAVSFTNTTGTTEEFFGAIFSNLVIFVFAIVGLGLILLSLYLFLKLFNPKFSIELLNNKICLGDELKFKVLCRSNLKNIEHFSISLVGMESAIYSIGTNTETEKHIFFEKDIPVNGKLDQMIGSVYSVKIPLDKMHSFKANHNAIEWKIVIKGEIAMYPDIDSEFIIKVGVK